MPACLACASAPSSSILQAAPWNGRTTSELRKEVQTLHLDPRFQALVQRMNLPKKAEAT